MNKLFNTLIVITAVLTINACEKSDNPGKNVNAFKKSKQDIIYLYESEYLGSSTSNINWPGNTSSCDAGSISSEAQTKTLQRINYFRKMADLADDITFDAAKMKNVNKQR